MSSIGWLGADTGYRDTGLVTVAGRELVEHATISRIELGHAPDAFEPIDDYARRVADEALVMFERLDELVDGSFVGIERVKAPSPRIGGEVRFTNPKHAIDAAVVLGALCSTFAATILVDPAGFGSNPLATYPVELVSDRERARPGWELRTGTGKLRHERSAYDALQAARAHAALSG